MARRPNPRAKPGTSGEEPPVEDDETLEDDGDGVRAQNQAQDGADDNDAQADGDGSAEAEPKPRKRAAGARRGPRINSQVARDFYRILRLCKRSGCDDGAITDAVAKAMIATMGSMPSFSVGESMLAASQAQSQMLMNAVANQQKTNMVAMATTTRCVHQLVPWRPDYPMPLVDVEEDDDVNL